MPRILFAISAHGLGHLGQAAPVCNALHAQYPDLELTLWSALPAPVLRDRIAAPFAHIAAPCDLGFVMHDALNVDVPASWAQYRDREARWAEALEAACTIVHARQPDLIVSDVGDMPLAAGQRLGIPTIAMSSLNWADLARHYFAGLSGSNAVLSRLDAIYARTTLALRLSPGMPMHGLQEKVLPPVGARSRFARTELDALLTRHLPHPDQPRLLIGMGGIETHLPTAQWPDQTDFNLIVANQSGLATGGDTARGIVNADTLRQQHGLRFTDLLAASDTVICKPGYGTFVEAALADRPVLYVCRQDWPEQAVLVNWIQTEARGLELEASDLARGHFRSAFDALSALPPRAPITGNGAAIAAQEILALCDVSDRKAQRRQ
jgi:hypothetical protein